MYPPESVCVRISAFHVCRLIGRFLLYQACLIDAASNQRLQQQEEEGIQPDSADGDPSWKNCWQKADNKQRHLERYTNFDLVILKDVLQHMTDERYVRRHCNCEISALYV